MSSSTPAGAIAVRGPLDSDGFPAIADRSSDVTYAPGTARLVAAEGTPRLRDARCGEGAVGTARTSAHRVEHAATLGGQPPSVAWDSAPCRPFAARPTLLFYCYR